MKLQQRALRPFLYWIALLLVAAFGIWIRVYRLTPIRGVGFDERFYQHYVTTLNTVGLTGYPKIVDEYVEHQALLSYSVLPPLRFLYIYTSHLWSAATGAPSMVSLRNVACLFTIFTLGISYVFGWRLGGKWPALAMLALMSCAPTQIHMSQHALVDGFFAFWALLCLWLLWENLRHPGNPARLLALASGLACMVMTKENAFFAFVGFCTILIANRWLQFGTVTPRLLAVMFIGPLLGVIALIVLAGGLSRAIEVYRESVSKNYTLPYAIMTGDGPWHRYLTDLLLMSPVVLILAVGEVLSLRRDGKSEWFFTIFIAASYLIMCNIKYGMNLRYTIMWDMPLRYLAFARLIVISNYFKSWKNAVLVFFIVALCLIDLHQYCVFFVRFHLYELVTADMLTAVRILKFLK